jgi:4,5-dihydroxyphthalate decarboxylase
MTNKPYITIGISAHPRTRALIEGKVEVDGYEIKVIHDFLSPGEQHHRFEQNEFDVCEFSTATFMRICEVDRRFVAIPVFFTRGPRQRNIFIKEGVINHPSELRGKRIGLSRYGATANVWSRGLLLDEYGLKTTEMHWYVSGHELFMEYELPVKLERPIKPMQFGQDQPHLGQLLAEEKLSAVIIPGDTGHHAIFGGGRTVRNMQNFTGVKSLFDDTEEIIHYVRQKRIYPIMHTIAMSAETVTRYPDFPLKLIAAFRQAKNLSAQYMSSEETAGYEKEKKVLGEDPYAYVLGATELTSLEALNRYQIEQGLMKRELDIRSLFVPGTI